MQDEKCFLIVDDDEIFLFTAGYAINRTFPGIKIITSRHGEDALDRLTEINPEVLFVDINMPVMDGWELLDKLAEKHTPAPYPIIIVSSSIDPADKRRADEHPLKPGFIEKPLTGEKLMAHSLIEHG